MDQLQNNSAQDFRAYLEQELARRSSTNPNYSLRAFARDLGVDSSFLSKLLNGKRSMTARTIMALAPRLSLTEDDVHVFVKNRTERRRRQHMNFLEIETLQEIENQKLNQLVEWYHLATLELVDVKGFQGQAPWIADQLGITVSQAQQCLEDLMSQGVLVQQAEGGWKREVTNHTMSAKKYPRLGLLKKHVLEHAAALAPQDIGDHSVITVSISESRLDEAKERIRRFRRELASFLSQPEEKDRVYQLAVSLFPVSK